MGPEKGTFLYSASDYRIKCSKYSAFRSAPSSGQRESHERKLPNKVGSAGQGECPHRSESPGEAGAGLPAVI